MVCNSPSVKLTTAVYKQKGFSLIELLVGMVALALALPIVATLLFPAVEQSIDQVRQIRAAELGQSIMNQIIDKAFDENSNQALGITRCGEGNVNCSVILGPEGDEVFENFDDVDDYHGLVENTTRYDSTLGELYSDFSVSIDVCNDSNYDGVCSGDTAIDNNDTAKLILISIADASGFILTFNMYRTNY